MSEQEGQRIEGAADLRIVLVTHPEEGAEAFARALVEERLVACANLSEVRSTYRWEGAVEKGREVLMILKTSGHRLRALERWVHRNHPYRVPEFLVLRTDAVSRAYGEWLRGSLGEEEGLTT